MEKGGGGTNCFFLYLMRNVEALPNRRLVFAFYCNCVLEIDWVLDVLHVILVNII